MIIGLFFSDSVSTILKILPPSILGVILFFAGLELASIARDIGNKRSDVYIMLVTAGLAMWNMGGPIWLDLFFITRSKKEFSNFDHPSAPPRVSWADFVYAYFPPVSARERFACSLVKYIYVEYLLSSSERSC